MLGFVRDRSSGRWGIFYAAVGDRPEAFFGFIQNRRHQVNGSESLSGLIVAAKLTGLPGWRAKSAQRIPKERRFFNRRLYAWPTWR